MQRSSRRANDGSENGLGFADHDGLFEDPVAAVETGCHRRPHHWIPAVAGITVSRGFEAGNCAAPKRNGAPDSSGAPYSFTDCREG